jgi:hypothetical protein
MLDAHAGLGGDITAAFRDYSHAEVLDFMLRALAHFRPKMGKEQVHQILGLFESFSCQGMRGARSSTQGAVLNSKRRNEHEKARSYRLFVAGITPDGSYLLFSRQYDIWVSFRDAGGGPGPSLSSLALK